MTRRCRVCKKPLAPEKERAGAVFCSERCRLVDLGKWLGEEYRFPGKPEEQEDEVPAPPEEPDG